jgi:soluble lytic murein transglycosylase-like protein
MVISQSCLRRCLRLISAAIALSAAAWGMSTPALAATDCFTAAAQYQGVNPLILRAIAWQESRDQPDAMNRNSNGSTDYGLMQINSIHLPVLAQYGISSDKLMDPCASVFIAAWHLRRQMDKYGNSWEAVGAYHSETPKFRNLYANQIQGILARWNVISQITPLRSEQAPARKSAVSRSRKTTSASTRTVRKTPGKKTVTLATEP